MVFLFLLLALSASAQFSDSFSDGDFSQQPAWAGDNTRFIIENSQLHLRAPSTTSKAYLSTPSQSIEGAIWTFTTHLDFNPSSSNYARVYLVSDKPDLNNDLNGYFVLIGGSADKISLYQQAGGTKTKIIDGADGRVDLVPVNVTIRVTRDEVGTWQLFSDVGNTGIPKLEGVQHNATFVASAYAGVACHYTTTRSDKFYFDDFVVTGMPYRDKTPPLVLSVQTVSSTVLAVFFDEPLDPTSTLTTTNYVVDNGISTPTTVEWLSDHTAVTLTFVTPFKNGISHLLTVSKVADVAGNTIISPSVPFLYLEVVPSAHKDIIITEIYADISPQIGLPNAEFIEVYNRTNHPFDLAGWQLSDGQSKTTLPKVIILPHSYRIITSVAKASLFASSIDPIGASSFPTLNDNEDALTFKNSLLQTIDSVHYTSDWYHNADKRNGGWSLELIDPDNICGEEKNWTASEHENGGTPGALNSVWANKPDLTGPKLISAVALSAEQVLLVFDEKLEAPLHSNITFTFVPPLTVSEYQFYGSLLRTLILRLNDSLQPKQLYTITADGVFDCSGNAIQSDFSNIDFALPETAQPNNILINEILFNPRANGVDFVELYNYTDKYIDLKNWHIGNIEDGQATNLKLISKTPSVLAPNTYMVLTPDAVLLKDYYPRGNDKVFHAMPLPTFPDHEGSVVLLRDDSVVIDRFFYNEDLHSPFLRDDEGVSLERISPSEETRLDGNWRSASANVGFATPGLENSNFRSTDPLVTSHVYVEPTVFVPYSGINDFAQINFRFDQSGLVASIKIFDHRGRVIKTIVNNETLGYEGFFRWEGDRDDGSRTRVGYYYVSFEVFADNGHINVFRNKIVITAP